MKALRIAAQLALYAPLMAILAYFSTEPRFSAETDTLQPDYADCWTGLKKRFNGTPEGDWS